jgi:alpha-N-acetylglucosaminidase
MRPFTYLVWLTCQLVCTAQSTEGILSLVARRLPDHVDDFTLSLRGNIIVPGSYAPKAANDEYTISSTDDGKISVEGNSLIALASG